MPHNSLVDDLEKVLGALTNLLASDSDPEAVKVVAVGKSSIKDTDYDNWNGGQTGYTVYLEVPQRVYHQLAGKHDEIERRLTDKVREITRLYSGEWIAGFVITTELVSDPHWREQAWQWCDMAEDAATAGSAEEPSDPFVIKATTPDAERFPDLSQIQRAVLKDSSRVRKVVSHTVIRDRHTQEVHHDAITIKTWKKGKQLCNIDYDHSISLSSEDGDEIDKLMTFLLYVRQGPIKERTGNYVVVEASSMPDPKALQQLLDTVSADGKAEAFAAVLKAATDDMEVFRALMQRASKDPHAFAEAAAALNLASYKAAVDELEALITAKGTRENVFQKHLEKYPWIFGSEYSERLDRRRWTRDETEDFVVRRTTDDYIELIEIKTPLDGQPLFNKDSSHDSFYPGAELAKVLGQVQKYIEKLDAARDSIRANDEEDTHKIRAKIVIGRDLDDNQRHALRSLNGHLHRIEIITFDQLLRIARRVIQYLGSSLERKVVVEELDEPDVPF
jgi:hypothetical protein